MLTYGSPPGSVTAVCQGAAPPRHAPPPLLHPGLHTGMGHMPLAPDTGELAGAPKTAPVDTGSALAQNSNFRPRSWPRLGAR